MKIEESTVRKLKITEAKALDPITVYIEEYGDGRAKVTIECYGQSWTGYWGSMGGDVKDFFNRVSVDYLMGYFGSGIDRSTNMIDKDDFWERFVPTLRKKVIEYRLEHGIDALTARQWYDFDWLENEDWCTSIFPEHNHEGFKIPSELKQDSSRYSLFFDEDAFHDFCEAEVGYTYERNHEYDYVCRVVEAVQQAITGKDPDWYKELVPVEWQGGYGRIIGSPEGCAIMDGQPSMFYVCTPGGTVTKMGRAWVNEIEEGSPEMEQLIHFEQLSIDREGGIYRGPNVLEEVVEKERGKCH